mmetsp:Transcript_4312/g.12046  ORF Transcript_4312/g.12046 Transcript_4312/m.12046 type:complete len:566 (+) Transcript_4312:59-1756(+)
MDLEPVVVPIVSDAVFAMLQSETYSWMFGLTIIVAFVSAFSIGANDVANAFADVVASRTLTLKQIVMIASVTELVGAVLMGNNTASTISGGIIDVDNFTYRQDLLMWGNFCILIGSGAWVLMATFLKMPVSTTHSVVGAVAGIGVASFGPSGVMWGMDWSEGTGLSYVILGFIISPVASGMFAAGLFLAIRFLVLNREQSFKWALYSLPVFSVFTIGIIMTFIVYKSSPKLGLSDLSAGLKVAVILPPAVVGGLVAGFFGIPYLRRKKNKKDMDGLVSDSPMETTPLNVDKVSSSSGDFASDDEEDVREYTTQGRIMAFLNRTLFYGINQDVVSTHGDAKMEAMHDAAVSYDEDTEDVFKALQVLSAAALSFSHGANDVANAIAPLAVVYQIWQEGYTTDETPVELWILAFGAIGMDIGLFFLGYRLMRNLGNNLTMLSPSRGFALELGTIITVLGATSLGLPVSTTHCITGATVAVGLCNGDTKAVNWRVVLLTMTGWMLTIPLAGVVSGCFFLFGALAPNKNYVDLYESFVLHGTNLSNPDSWTPIPITEFDVESVGIENHEL